MTFQVFVNSLPATTAVPSGIVTSEMKRPSGLMKYDRMPLKSEVCDTLLVAWVIELDCFLIVCQRADLCDYGRQVNLAQEIVRNGANAAVIGLCNYSQAVAEGKRQVSALGNQLWWTPVTV